MVKRRNTKAKSMVLELLEKQAQPMAQAELERLLKDEADRVTIYRILRSFCADGKVHKIIGDDGKTYFARCKETCSSHNHHTDQHIHFRCTKCDTVECLHDEVHVQLPKGYVMEHTNYVISGTCDKCHD
jgi:Fur family transcriptional regulator, ferric uptake regulator